MHNIRTHPLQNAEHFPINGANRIAVVIIYGNFTLLHKTSAPVGNLDQAEHIYDKRYKEMISRRKKYERAHL
jgi:hypothetical protein